MIQKILNSTKKGKNGKNKGFYLEIDETQQAEEVIVAEAPLEEVVAQTETDSKPDKAKPTAKPDQAKPAPKAQLADSRFTSDTPDWVKQLYKEPASQNGQESAPRETTFAPKYLAPTPNFSRRRPGPSMDKYMDMASQMKPGR